MGYFFNVEELVKNPCVKKVSLRGMTLTTAFRVQLFQAWKASQNVEAIVQMLEENGITKELTSDTYALSIENSFKMGGDLKKRIELSDGNDELHQLANQFNEMFSRLDDSFQAQQQFVSDASHELRTPVTVIRAQCDLTLEEEEASPEEYREALEVIRRQSKKLSRLISDMLDFARLELQPERYQKEELDFSALVEDVCSDMALIRENNITLTCEAEPNIRIRGNRELLTRLLTNLISNAYRYGKTNGHIWVYLRPEPGHSFVLSVQDDGIGIAPEEQPNIFRRFYQADPSRSGKGNGLGLAMVKEIAEFHGGEIRVQSEPGVGSTFKFSLF